MEVAARGYEFCGYIMMHGVAKGKSALRLPAMIFILSRHEMYLLAKSCTRSEQRASAPSPESRAQGPLCVFQYVCACACVFVCVPVFLCLCLRLCTIFLGGWEQVAMAAARMLR